MSDEPNPKDQPETDNGEWKMPEPVFRSSKGQRVKGGYEGDEHETEMANATMDHIAFEETLVDSPLGPVEAAAPAPAEANKVRAVPPKKKGGCAASFVFMLGAIGLGVAAIVLVVVYFLYYYKPVERSFQ